MIAFRPAPASLPPGQRIYAVGDVHGCLDRLLAIHFAIAEDLIDRQVDHATLIHLGDYVDRGPDSARVVAVLADGNVPPGISATVNLAGNHEDMMLSALAGSGPDAVGLWLLNGGSASLRSWGLPRTGDPSDWARLIPPAHLNFVRNLAVMHRIGDYAFVHAGVCPGIPLGEQSRHDLLWIREPFLSSPDPFEAIIVHGHTPMLSPVVRSNRIGIDTGAVMGGYLTCAVLEADRVGFITR